MADGGKGSQRRPGSLPVGAWERIFSKEPLPITPTNAGDCCPTDDGPGQVNADDGRPPYERRKTNREGV